MQKKETAIEVKVGALVLFATALLVAFVIVLGDFSFSKGFQFHVEFENAGGLKPGADVAIAGLNVGSVQKLQFVKNEKNKGMNVVVVRATLNVEKKYAESVRENSQFYITTRGVLGEPYVEIVTETFDKPSIKAGVVMRGVDPPRLDLIVAKASKLLTVLTNLLDNPEIATKDLLTNAASLVKNVNEILTANRQNIDGTFANAKTGTEEAAKLLKTLNVAVDDGDDLKNIVSDASMATRDLRRTARRALSITNEVDRKLTPILDNADVTAKNAREISQTTKSMLAKAEPKIDKTLDNVVKATDDVTAITADSKVVAAKIKDGEGTVGKLLVDREVYDDIKELMRQIKRKPWKIIWKE